MSIEDAREELYKLGAIIQEKLRDSERKTDVQRVDMCKKMARMHTLETFLKSNDVAFNKMNVTMIQTIPDDRDEMSRYTNVHMRLRAKLEAHKLKNIQ